MLSETDLWIAEFAKIPICVRGISNDLLFRAKMILLGTTVFLAYTTHAFASALELFEKMQRLTFDFLVADEARTFDRSHSYSPLRSIAPVGTEPTRF